MLGAWADRKFFQLAAFPGFALLIVITGVPLVAAVFLSFTAFDPASFSFHWVGTANYRYDFGSLGTDIYNTYVFVGLSIAVETVLGIVVAALLAQRTRGAAALRAIYALPLLVATIASAVAWHALLDPTSGWIDYFLHLGGLGQPAWLADPRTAMLSVVIADAWSGIPTVAFIVLAGMLSLAPGPLEAARLDGCSSWQTFWRIKAPALRPVIAFAVLYRLLNLFQEFVLFQVMTGGGPGTSTMTVGQQVYFGVGDPGAGGALAIILVLMMALPLALLFPLIAPRRAESKWRRLLRRHPPSPGRRTVRGPWRRALSRTERPASLRRPALSAPTRRRLARALTLCALLVGALFILLPVIWIAETAFQTPFDAFQVPPHFLFRPTLANFRALYSGADVQVVPYFSDIGHSVIVLLSSMAIALGLGAPAGYALARSRFRGSRTVTTGLIAVYVTPSVLYVIPLYFIYTRLQVNFTYPALVLFYETFELPLTIFLMRSYFAEVPAALEEAARVDGCTHWQALRHVVLPVVRPGLTTVAVLVAISSWGEYFGALIFTTNTIQTAPVAIETYVSLGTSSWSVLAAATLVLIVPVLVLTVFLLKGFTKRFTFPQSE